VVDIDRADALAAIHRVLWKVFLVGAAIVVPLFGLASWSVLRLRTRLDSFWERANLTWRTTLRVSRRA
jgi:hypothetical protein